jgi:hypothetical protein
VSVRQDARSYWQPSFAIKETISFALSITSAAMRQARLLEDRLVVRRQRISLPEERLAHGRRQFRLYTDQTFVVVWNLRHFALQRCVYVRIRHFKFHNLKRDIANDRFPAGRNERQFAA